MNCENNIQHHVGKILKSYTFNNNNDNRTFILKFDSTLKGPSLKPLILERQRSILRPKMMLTHTIINAIFV